MKKFAMLMVTVVTLMAGTVACSGDDDSSGADNRDNRVMGFRDASIPIVVVPAQAFAIELPNTAGTGYEWTVTSQPDADIAAITDAEGVVTPGDDGDGGVGTTGSTRFELKAVGSGTTTITFTYARPSDPADDPTITTFTINVS